MKTGLPVLGLLLLLLAAQSAFGQQGLATYTPTLTTGITYTSIAGTGTGPAFFRNTTSVSTDDNLSSAVDIGFNFVYDGVQVCQAQISTNGFLSLNNNTGALGSGTGAFGYVNNNTFTTAASTVRVIAPFYDDQQTAANAGTLADLQASIKYQTIGSAPNRVFIVEWINMQDFNTVTTASLNYQVQLFEGSNNIRFVYGNMNPGTATWTYTTGINSITLAGASPFATTMLFTQQTANTNTFGGTAQNTLATIPNSNTQIDLVYGGPAPVALSGNYTLPGSFTTFTEAINALNYHGTAGAVTLNVAAGSNFVEDVPALQTGCHTHPITIQKSGGGPNPSLRPTGGAGTSDFGFRMLGVDNLTWDGINIIENTGSAVEFGIFLSQLSDRNGCQNNTFRNFTVTLNRANASSLGVLMNSAAAPALIPAGANSSNVFKNFTITNVAGGVQFNGALSGLYNIVAQPISLDNNNMVTNDVCTNYNIIGDPLTPNDISNGTAGGYGLFLLGQANLTVRNCSISNITSTGTGGVFGIIANGTSTAQMPTNAFNQGTFTIANNRIFGLNNFTSTTAGVISGIRANVNGNAGSVTRIYNNAIGGMSSASTVTTTRRVVGIQLQDAGTGANSAIEVWHNSVSLNPTSLTCPNACLEAYTTTTGPVFTVRNNILANYTGAQSGNAKHYAIASSSATVFGNTGSVSNNNDLFISNATNGFVGRGAAVDYATVANWTTATTHDAASYSTDPIFVSAVDLHVTNLALDNLGVAAPAYITTDFDCTPRSVTTPDPGGDEFSSAPCGGTPTPGTATLSVGTTCSNVPVTLSLFGYSPETGIVLQWQASAIPGGPYTPIPGANLANYTGALPIAGTYYITCRVTCTNSGLSAVSNEVSLVVHPTPTVMVSPTSGMICAPAGSPITLTASSSGGTGAVTYTWNPTVGLTPTTGSPVSANPPVTTPYIVTGTDINGCAGTATSTITVNPTVNIQNITATPSAICGGNTAALNVQAATTANYTVTPVPFVSIPSGSGTTTLCNAGVATTALTAGTLDDGYWNGITLPFPFSYYGSPYTTINVGTNGYVSFSPITATQGYASAPQMANVAVPNNMIGGCFGDLYWTSGGTISCYTSGTAPNRVFVINFNGIPGPGGFYNSGVAPVNLTSFEIQLFESGHRIQVHTTAINNGSSTSNHTMGVENSGGTAAVIVTGRSTSLWSATNDGIEFTPSGGSFTYNWTPAAGLTPSATVSNPTTPALASTTLYSVTVTDATGCTANGNVTVNVTPAVVPGITIVAAPGTTVCAGTNVTFTATPSGGGTTPAYQWKKNGLNVGTNSTTYSDNGLVSGDQITCELTSNAVCASPTTATSNTLTMTVNPNVTASITIAANPGTTICAGTNVTFTATPVNEGTTPAYQWKKNGLNVGTNSTTYSDNGLVSGDQITCELTTSDPCATPATTTSNMLTMTVNPLLTPNVTIAANPGTTICAGTNVTFTATPTNEGSTPMYEWFLNGAPVGTNSPTYSNSSLLNGDAVACRLTSSEPCAAPLADTSNVLVISVVSSVTPSVSIVVSPNDTICPGTSATFTATAVNAGTTPSYQWRLNGGNVGTNSPTYVNGSLVTGDQVNVEVTSNDPCASPVTANSNTVTMTAGDFTVPTAVCQNLTVALNASGNGSTTATAVNNGSTDNCTASGSLGLGISPSSFTCANLGANNVVLTVTDAASNTNTCVGVVTVVDNILPAISCPGNSAVNADPGQCTAAVTYSTPSGTDNCTPTTSQTAGLASGASFPVGVTTNTFRVTDASSNSATCSFTVTVTDNQAPGITCPGNMSVGNGAGQCSAVVTYSAPNGTDNCGGSSTTQVAGQASGTAFPVGVTTNTFRVTDGASNTATCSFTVTVTDTESPTWSACPSNITASTGSGTCDAVVTWTAPSSADNCSVSSSSGTHNPGATFPLGTTTVTYSATDANSNTGSCSFTVTVSDNTAPSAVCQNVTVTLDAFGNGSTTASAVDNGSSDACGVDTLVLSQTAFTCADAGSNTVVLTVTDDNGNTSTCNATVTVNAQAVTGTATGDTLSCGYNVSCAGGSDGTVRATGGGGCPGYTFLWSTGDTTGTVTGLGAGTYTVTVTDGAGGTSVSSVTLTAPAALTVTGTSTSSCPGDSTGSADITPAGGNDCFAYAYIWSNGATTQDLSNVPAGSYTVTVTDNQGCTATQTVTVGAFTAPSPGFTQAGNTLTSTQAWATYQWLLNGSPISGATGISHTVTVTGNYSLMVTDANGCSGTSAPVLVTGVGGGMDLGLTLYPNPARGEFRLRTASPIGHGLTVSIMDMYGHRLAERALPGLSHEAAFDIRGFSAGTYFVEIVTEYGQRRLIKLVVQ